MSRDNLMMFSGASFGMGGFTLIKSPAFGVAMILLGVIFLLLAEIKR